MIPEVKSNKNRILVNVAGSDSSHAIIQLVESKRNVNKGIPGEIFKWPNDLAENKNAQKSIVTS